jgi:hypothetical protein
MWHIILPPLIIISGIGILLWFFSRRMDDPSFLSRVKSARSEVSAVSRSRSLSRKAFFLKLLEKSISKFKTNSLRIHNFFQYFLERLRVKRQRIDEMRREAGQNTMETERVDGIPEKKGGRRWIGAWRRKNVTDEFVPTEKPSSEGVGTDVVSESTTESQANGGVPEPIISEIPNRQTASVFGGIFGRRRAVDASGNGSELPSSVREEPVAEPVLSKKVTHPERPKRRIMKKDPREESLISQIAENPRDAAAYEELGDLYLVAENMQDAKACYRQVLKLHPTNRAVKLKIRKVERFFEENIS